MMDIEILDQLEYLLRILVAGCCGAIIGYERESHMKSAGIRTHLIVSMASALVMVVSKYGFNDVIKIDGIGLDPSRVASGAVTAIGFLGAGVIFVRKQNVSGITTSAGLWATVGVGTAVGAGMYLIGAVAALLVLLVHKILNRKSRLVKEAMSEQIVLVMSMEEDPEKILSTIFSMRHIDIINFKAKRLGDDNLEIRAFVRYPETYEIGDIMSLIKEVPAIKSIEI